MFPQMLVTRTGHNPPLRLPIRTWPATPPTHCVTNQPVPALHHWLHAANPEAKSLTWRWSPTCLQTAVTQSAKP